MGSERGKDTEEKEEVVAVAAANTVLRSPTFSALAAPQPSPWLRETRVGTPSPPFSDAHFFFDLAAPRPGNASAPGGAAAFAFALEAVGAGAALDAAGGGPLLLG